MAIANWRGILTLCGAILPVGGPAVAGNPALHLAAPFQNELADNDMARLRGGFLGLPTGSSVFVQIGALSSNPYQKGSPSSATASLSAAGASLHGSATLSSSASLPPLSLFSNSSVKSTMTVTHSIGISLVGGS
jgi:hypothetical protein